MSKNVYRKYDIKIANHFGHGHFASNTAIAFDRFVYWFRRNPEGFWKFKQACKRKPGLYRKGDSWGEELGMSRKVLDRVFDRLVTHYKTKSAYLEATDKFAGKIFCSYTNHKTSQTHYYIDWEALRRFQSSLAITIPPISHPSPLEVKAVSDVPKTIGEVLPSDVPLEHHLTCARQTAFNTQTITSFAEPPSRPPVDKLDGEEIKLISKKMISTWNSQMQDRVVLWPSMAPKLHDTLKNHFEGSLEKWKKYCETIASDKFLSGKSSSSYKLFLYQAIKPEFIEMRFGGELGTQEKDQNSKFELLTNRLREVRREMSQIEGQNNVIDQTNKRISTDVRNKMKESIGSEAWQILRDESDREFGSKIPSSDDAIPALIRLGQEAHFDAILKRKFKHLLVITETIPIPQKLIEEEKFLVNEIAKESKGASRTSFEPTASSVVTQAWKPEPPRKKEHGLRKFDQLFSFG